MFIYSNCLIIVGQQFSRYLCKNRILKNDSANINFTCLVELLHKLIAHFTQSKLSNNLFFLMDSHLVYMLCGVTLIEEVVRPLSSSVKAHDVFNVCKSNVSVCTCVKVYFYYYYITYHALILRRSISQWSVGSRCCP